MGAPLSTTGLRTAADLSYEPDDGLRRELHDGMVPAVPPPNDDHSWEGRAADRARAGAIKAGHFLGTLLH
ncbi:MAG: hypothetical protein M3Q39_07845 [Actinomycetota bacterium]|nr:hypothetical protein [Actinomycetota bacterium]